MARYAHVHRGRPKQGGILGSNRFGKNADDACKHQAVSALCRETQCQEIEPHYDSDTQRGIV